MLIILIKISFNFSKTIYIYDHITTTTTYSKLYSSPELLNKKDCGFGVPAWRLMKVYSSITESFSPIFILLTRCGYIGEEPF